jgi:hypothetical protein
MEETINQRQSLGKLQDEIAVLQQQVEDLQSTSPRMASSTNSEVVSSPTSAPGILDLNMSATNSRIE